MCCHGRDRRCSNRRAKRAERWAKRHDPSKIRRRLRQVKIAQSITLFVYFLYSLQGVGLLSDQIWFTSFTPLLTFTTLVITATSFLCGSRGYKSKTSLGWSIAADAVCLSLQVYAVIGIIAAKSSRRCFSGHLERTGPPCGVIWAIAVFSNILLSFYIHTIVRAAILISILRRQSRQPLPVSTQDEGPPVYPAVDANLPAYSNEDTFTLGKGAGKPQKEGTRGTSVASSTTISGPIVTPYSSEESDGSDDGREDQPLLRF